MGREWREGDEERRGVEEGLKSKGGRGGRGRIREVEDPFYGSQIRPSLARVESYYDRTGL